MPERYIDWNSHLLPGGHEIMTDPKEAAEALCYLQTDLGIKTLCMMPSFLPFSDSVAIFLLRRHKSLSRLSESLAILRQENRAVKPFKLLCGATVQITPNVHEIDDLKKLTVKFNSKKYLPIQLPIAEFEYWIDYEINRLLYRTGVKLWFVSFDIACKMYPRENIEKMLRISDAIYQFNYRSLEDPYVQRVISKLLKQRSVVLLGTSLDCQGKVYRYDLDYYLKSAKEFFSPAEYAMLMKYNQTLPDHYPVVFRQVNALTPDEARNI